MADKSIDTENGYEVLKDGYYVYLDKDLTAKDEKWIFCDRVKWITDTRDFFPRNDFTIQAVHVFKNEKDAQKFIDNDCKYFEYQNELKIARIPNTLGEWYESKKSTTKSIKESADDNWYKLKMLNEMLDAMEEDEYNIPKLGIYGVTKNIDLDEGAIEALIKYYK